MDLEKERPWSVARAAAFLGVHQRTIERYFEQGLERTKLGGKVYTSRAAINRFQRADPPTVRRDRSDEAALAREAAADEVLDEFGV